MLKTQLRLSVPLFAAVALHDLWHRLWVALGVRERVWLSGIDVVLAS